jgi:hypothetical protein
LFIGAFLRQARGITRDIAAFERKSKARADSDSSRVSKRPGGARLWREQNAEDTTVLPNIDATPAKIVGELLGSHPEAESLLAEAGRRRALAASSAAESGQKFAAAQAARLGYETLRHRLEPRRAHLVHFDVGLLLLSAPSAGIVMLSLFELRGLGDGAASGIPLALAATAVWMTLAWLAAAAACRRALSLVFGIVGVSAVLGVLLAALHALAPGPGLPPVRGAVLSGALAAALIFGLSACASAVVGRLEPASLVSARRRWHRARSDYDRTERIRQADLEAAAIALEAWLELVRVRVIMVSDGDERRVHEAMALAAELLEAGRPQLSSAG